MNAHEKEAERVLLEDEKEVLKQLDKTYKQAQKDVNTKLKEIDNQLKDLIKKQTENKDPEQAEFIESQIRSKVYQKKYQQALKDQINGYLDVLKSKHIESVNDYLKVTYEDGFLTNIYNLQKYGIPVTVPVNQELLVKSITYPTEKIPLSKRLYDNIEKTKKKVISEVSRGIATGSSYSDIARNIQNQLGVSFRKAKQIAQNEGQRVKIDARMDSMYAAKKKGADIVKVWDSTLDNKTRPVHRELDQQHAELDKPFKCSAGEVQAPKKFGIAALDINCRCALLSVPRWDIEDTVQKRDNISGELIEAKNYEDWAYKYHKELSRRYKAEQEANKLIEKAKLKDKVITKILKQAVGKGTGKLFGLDFRIKSQGSLERKLLSKSQSKGISVEEYAQQVTDVLRYTNVSNGENLTDDYFKIIEFMIEKEYNVIEVTNTFITDGMYKGINTLMQDKEGYVFELQYHTPQSIDIKEINHKLYEEWRLDTTPIQRKDELVAEMIKNAKSIIVPKNVEMIKNK